VARGSAGGSGRGGQRERGPGGSANRGGSARRGDERRCGSAGARLGAAARGHWRGRTAGTGGVRSVPRERAGLGVEAGPALARGSGADEARAGAGDAVMASGDAREPSAGAGAGTQHSGSSASARKWRGQEQVLERAMAAQEEWVRGSRAHERRPQLGWRERLRHELMRRDASELASSEYGS
jgi:hypothetical protein